MANKTKYEIRHIYFEVWDKELVRWMPTRFPARCWQKDEQVYKLFRIGTMAKVLSRSVGWIQQLERDKKFPETLFEVDGCNSRYYSEDQIRMASFFQRAILGDNPSRIRGQGLNMPAWYKALKENWGVLNFDSANYEITFEETGRNDVRFDD